MYKILYDKDAESDLQAVKYENSAEGFITTNSEDSLGAAKMT